MGQKHRFGGMWTEEKLGHLERYLEAYLTALKNQPFDLLYIDAFAGTGQRDGGKRNTEEETKQASLLANDPDLQSYTDGSPRIALSIEEPKPFDRYVFVEKNRDFARDLSELKVEFPDRNIEIHCDEANQWIQRFCRQSWSRKRAVMFLDPYSIEVEWETLRAIAATKAIDLWLLFPLGNTVNRMLPKSGDVPKEWVPSLDRLFGTNDWSKQLYKPVKPVQASLFDSPQEILEKVPMDGIRDYFTERLKTIFEGVVAPKYLYNSKSCPIFMLCFAAGNKKGAKIATDIADYILQHCS